MAQKLSDEIGRISEKEDVFLAQTQEMVGKLNFAQTSVTGEKGRVALRPLYDPVMRGARWAPGWWIKLSPKMAPGKLEPIDRAADVRIYPDACTTDGWMAAIALFTQPEGDLKGRQRTLYVKGRQKATQRGDSKAQPDGSHSVV